MASPSTPSSNAPQPLMERMLPVVKSLQFAWFTGHVMTLLGSFLFALSYVTFSSSVFSYKLAYLGAFVSYVVVLYKQHGVPKANAQYAQRLITDENAQYLILAAYWLFTKPIEVTLIPFSTFSVFHTLGYIRTTIIPVVSPSAKTAGSPASKVQGQIKSWTEKNYGNAMRLVARAEVMIIMGRLLLGLFKLRILPIFIFAQFLRFRFHLSTYTGQAFTDLRVKLDQILLPPTADPRIPPAVSKAYAAAKELVIRYGDAVTQQQPARQ